MPGGSRFLVDVVTLVSHGGLLCDSRVSEAAQTAEGREAEPERGLGSADTLQGPGSMHSTLSILPSL